MAHIAPDNEHMVYLSDRSGPIEIWVSRLDGTEARMVTRAGGQRISTPVWSPDGKHIAYSATGPDGLDIYVLDARGGQARQLTEDGASDINPTWSADGRFIYFASSRSGQFEIWRTALTTGETVQVTSGGGWRAMAGASGDHIYYSREAASQVWRLDMSEGKPREAPTPLLPDSVRVYGYGWHIKEDAFYWIGLRDGVRTLLRHRLDEEGRVMPEEHVVHRFELGPYLGHFAVTPDHKKILYAFTTRYSGQLFKMEASPEAS